MLKQVFMSWLQRTAMGKQNTLRLSAGSDEGDTEQDIGEDGLRADGSGEGDDAMGGASEERLARYNDEDIPLTWAEVTSIVQTFWFAWLRVSRGCFLRIRY